MSPRLSHRTIPHGARPGPGYWNYRCLVCGEYVAKHMYWWERLVKRITHKKVRYYPE